MSVQRSQDQTTARERRYWLWVTRPEYYWNEDGNDSEYLDPDSGADSDGWWTCHKDTQKGDLVLLWRTLPLSDIGYLIQAESDAYTIADDEHASEMGWDYGCDYQVLYKFKNPIGLHELRQSPYLEDWGALRANFRRRVYGIPNEHWLRLSMLASQKNFGYHEFLTIEEMEPVSTKVLREEQLEETLANDLGRLRTFGYHLVLYSDPITRTSGRQLVCTGPGGRIDLLCHDDRKHQYVVIELKNVRASYNTFGQIASYVGWVQKRIAQNEPVLGLVISRGADARFKDAIETTPSIYQIDLDQLGFT